MRFLATSTQIEDFKNILTALLNIMLSETDGWTEGKIEIPSETSRQYLLKKIKCIEIMEEMNEASMNELNEEYTDENADDHTTNQINKFIGDIELLCKNNSKIETVYLHIIF